MHPYDRKLISSSPPSELPAQPPSSAIPYRTTSQRQRLITRLAAGFACLSIVAAALDAVITRIRVDQAAARVAQLRQRRDDLIRIARLSAERNDIQHHNAAFSRAIRDAFSDQPRLAAAPSAEFSVELDDTRPPPLPGAVSRMLAVMPRATSESQPAFDRFASQGPLQHVMATFTAAANEAQRAQAANSDAASRGQASPSERSPAAASANPAPGGAR